MKQLSLLAGFLFCTTAVLAQRPAETTQSMKPQPATEQEAAIAKQLGLQAKNQARGGGAILYQETFSNGFDGSNGNGAWTVNDNQDGNLWIWVTPEGQGLYPGEVPTGSAHPGGNYSTTIGALESTTAGDGWMIFDNDYWHGGPINANNPASSEALIRFVLSQSETAVLEVRDLQGRIMVTKDYGTLAAGEHNERVDVSTWAAGTYTYTLIMGDARQTRKLMVD